MLEFANIKHFDTGDHIYVGYDQEHYVLHTPEQEFVHIEAHPAWNVVEKALEVSRHDDALSVLRQSIDEIADLLVDERKSAGPEVALRYLMAFSTMQSVNRYFIKPDAEGRILILHGHDKDGGSVKLTLLMQKQYGEWKMARLQRSVSPNII